MYRLPRGDTQGEDLVSHLKRLEANPSTKTNFFPCFKNLKWFWFLLFWERQRCIFLHIVPLVEIQTCWWFYFFLIDLEHENCAKSSINTVVEYMEYGGELIHLYSFAPRHMTLIMMMFMEAMHVVWYSPWVIILLILMINYSSELLSNFKSWMCITGGPGGWIQATMHEQFHRRSSDVTIFNSGHPHGTPNIYQSANTHG